MNYNNGKKPTKGDAVFYRDATNLLHACRVQRVERDGKLWLREAGASEPLPDPVPAETCILQADYNAAPPVPTSPLAGMETDQSSEPPPPPPEGGDDTPLTPEPTTNGEPLAEPLSPEPTTSGEGNATANATPDDTR